MGELDCLGGNHDIPTDTASQVPGVDEEVQCWKAQTVANRAPTDRRFHLHRQVNVCNCLTGGSYERVPPEARITHNIGTRRIAGRPHGLPTTKEFGTEPNGCADVTKNIQRRPFRTW